MNGSKTTEKNNNFDDFEWICYLSKIKKYQCKLCDYITSEKSNMKKHINTKKHKMAGSLTSQKVLFRAKSVEKYEKKDKYFCRVCNYNTSKIGNYTRHLQSKKHGSFLARFNKNNEPKTTYDDNMEIELYKDNKYSINKYEEKQTKIEKLENMVENLIEQNIKITDTMQKTIEKQNMTICEIAKQPKIVNNNSFNVMNYLNNECKDAINFSDFIDKLKISYDDLLKIRKNGYVYGMEKSIIDNLIKLEQRKRPIQCTDIKRKQFFIKDQEKWNKDNKNMKLNKALCDVTTKHIYELQQWKDKNPDWMDNDNKLDIITDITCQILKGSTDDGEKLKNKIYDKLSKAVKIVK